MMDFIQGVIYGESSDKEEQMLILSKSIENNFDLVVCDKPYEVKSSALEVIEM